ncbi:hypothetical protein AB0M46_30590 [Dactylosporangium sp. NPDC051485]|uniref:hypothetical protein n=1 Tax=Dactylosporangium sp. NPDC051485 TaxID=3154846 RepID=UPI00343545AA
MEHLSLSLSLALSLADYRARVAAMYLSEADLAGFRARRDDLFATHPQSAVPARCATSRPPARIA